MTPRIGLALSGGGFRATAFGLGCLRALNDRGVLPYVRVVSGISGGSLLAALWAYGPAVFEEFDERTVALLRRGIEKELVIRALQPVALARGAVASMRLRLPSGDRLTLRSANRTDALRALLADEFFGDRIMQDVSLPDLATVLTATDLRTGNAVRFGSRVSACSPHGSIVEDVRVADAVAASAAFPVALPAIERVFTFQPSNGDPHRKALLLTDGGVYDNLGLSVLQPGRSTPFTPHVYDTDYVISVDAGRGKLKPSGAHFMALRLKRSADITFQQAQNLARGRLHDAAQAGQIRGFVQAYLGMRDKNLPVPVADFVRLDEVASYGTRFRSMPESDLDNISLRGEQLVRSLLAHYTPELG